MRKFGFGTALVVSLMLLFSACQPSETHFLKDSDYRAKVHTQFMKRKALAKGREKELFSVLDNKSLSLEKKEALEFLYAYMPLSDLADYDGNYYLKQVETAFQARNYFKWGKSIPDDIFRHFVLFYRVNNENLDTARQVFFNELKDRIKNMDMKNAVLEVNHWCHEKVTYRGTDERTSGPLSLERTSWGRCGEESTFTVTALRAVGIPARQCYTPRWAHTDDNHAWVEAWIDGKWQYIGACEPQPELNTAWFTGPAMRAMMVHTNVVGLYNGPEEKNVKTDFYSVINLLSNYATTRKVQVKVVDNHNKPVEGAKVKFDVYNYGEFYPIAETVSDANGMASIMSGLGDLLIWANNGEQYGYAKSSPNTDVTVVALDRAQGKTYNEMITLTPPVEKPVPTIPAAEIAANSKRLEKEDSIRNAYMNTFIKENAAKDFAKANKFNADLTWKYLSLAQGNWKEIKQFMTDEKSNKYLFDFLASLTEKDFRDTPASYLEEHINAANKTDKRLSDADYAHYVLSPRINNELIRPWRTFLKNANLPVDAKNPVPSIIKYIRENINITNSENYERCPLSPQGSVELKITDRHSRDILFVAICRTMNIPSRIDPATQRPQYMDKGQWVDVYFDGVTKEQPKATVVFTNAKENIVKPGYGTHFTLDHYENGNFVTLNYEEMTSIPAKRVIDAGYYRLMIGTRANDGSVTISTQYFTIKPNETKTLEIKLPKTQGRLEVQGIVDPNTVVVLKNGAKKSLKELMNGKGLFLCFADPGQEPTKHILQDLPAQQKFLEKWNGGILFAIPNDKLSTAFDPSVFKGMPKQSLWMVDNNRVLLKSVADVLHINFSDNFPLVVYLSNNGGILYSNQGYKIGIGENLAKIITTEQEIINSTKTTCTGK